MDFVEEKMKIALLGASGRTGGHVMRKALAKGYEVTALVRDPGSITVKNDKLHIIQGNAFIQEDVEKAVVGADAVVCAIGTRSIKEGDTVSRSAGSIAGAMKKHGVKRIVSISTMGAGDSMKRFGFMLKLIMKAVLGRQIRDHERHEETLRQSGLDWTVVRPGSLRDAPAKGRYSAGFDLKPSSISREDVADFIMAQLESDTYLHKSVSVSD